MPLLILGMIRAIWALRHDRQFGSLALLTLVAIVSGTGFYSIVEGFRVVDALYFSVITLTTVGYGDLAPETDVGKLFTVVYVLVGIGLLLAFVSTLAAKMSQTSPLDRFRDEPTRNGGDSRSPAAVARSPPSRSPVCPSASSCAEHTLTVVNPIVESHRSKGSSQCLETGDRSGPQATLTTRSSRKKGDVSSS